MVGAEDSAEGGAGVTGRKRQRVYLPRGRGAELLREIMGATTRNMETGAWVGGWSMGAGDMRVGDRTSLKWLAAHGWICNTGETWIITQDGRIALDRRVV